MHVPVRTAVALVIMLVAAILFSSAEAQEALTKQDRQGPVTVSATLLSQPAAATPLKVKVVFDTHSVSLDSIALENAVALRRPDGTDVAPTAVEQAKGNGHHREAVVVFPAPGEDSGVRLVVKNVGGVNERVFDWEFPAGR